MKHIQNIVEKIAVKLICTSIIFFSISAVGIIAGIESIARLFGYLGIFCGLLMLAAGSIMSISFILYDYYGAQDSVVGQRSQNIFSGHNETV